jgi:putative ABC transport system substrate-binding protein
MIRRRSIQALAAGILVAAMPRVASAAREVKRVGVMARPGGLKDHWKQGFPGAFAAHGFVEGKNLEIDWFDKLLPDEIALLGSEAAGQKIAARMARAGLDCLITYADPGTRYLQEATRTIPIVTDVQDPVAAGFANTLARPGGNITGLHQGGAEITNKNIEMLRKLVPDATGVAWWGWAGLVERIKAFEGAGRALGIRTHVVAVKEMGGQGIPYLRKEVAGLRRQGCTIALVEMGDDVLLREAATLAREHRIAVAAGTSVDEGFLLNYTSNRDPEQRSVRRIPAIVARILRGARPEDMPFEGPSRYQLFLNLKTASSLGIAIPPEVMMAADRLIR